MSSPPSQRQRQNSPGSNDAATAATNNAAAAQAALAAAAAIKQASSEGVVRICGTSPSECGYCKGSRAPSVLNTTSSSTPDAADNAAPTGSSSNGGSSTATTTTSSQSYSLLGDFMTPKTYEGFLYRGWRRSGTYLYKPNNWQSCCPALTIRLPVRQFLPTKSQRKVAKKMEHLVQPTATSTTTTSSMPSGARGGVHTEDHYSHEKRKNKRKHPQGGQHNANQPTQNSNNAAAHTSQSSSGQKSSDAEDVILESVLHQLQIWSQGILQSVLEQNPNIKNLTVNPKFKVKAMQGKAHKKHATAIEQETTTSLPSTVTVCTTICPALAGQSKGILNRDDLSQQLSQRLESTYGGGTSHRLSSLSSWKLQQVHRHAKSGQVFCDIQLPVREDNNGVSSSSTSTPAATGMIHGSSNSKSNQYNDDASMHDVGNSEAGAFEIDKLHAWLEEHGPSMAPFCTGTGPVSTASTIDECANTVEGTMGSAATRKYPFVVKTLPAHQSALDPAVHKLYFLYQHKVHQDSDPFTCDLANTKANNTSNSSGMNAPTEDASGMMEDDEWSTPTTSDGNNLVAPPQTANTKNEKLSPTLPPPPSHSSGSTPADRTSASFIDTAKRMLQREYAHLPHARLKQVTKSYGSFFQFLVESPFKPLNGTTTTSKTTQIPPSTASAAAAANNTPRDALQAVRLPCGTYHQQYRVAGMLVAVGVVDILPQGLSSVYLFYHPQFARDLVPLGKYAILQEIQFTRSLQIPYYYLGYYIESCTKMRYKAEYRPSELLCPTTYRWVDAMLAQRVIHAFSPVRHCCTLYYQDKIQLEHDLLLAEDKRRKSKNAGAHRLNGGASNASNNSTAGSDDGGADDMSMDDLPPSNPALPADSLKRTSSAATKSSSATSTTKSILKKPNPAPFPLNPLVEQVKMDVGVGIPVTLSMLHERGRDTVRPLLEEFVKEAGHELSQKCLVKFS